MARGRASPSFQEPIFEDSSHSPSAYALALYSGLWAIDGWDQINYVGGEMKDPGKTMPRVIHSSMAIVVVSYLVSLSDVYLKEAVSFSCSKYFIFCRVG